ncbi:MAG: hypothetical protein GTO12_11625 [Proteobacteria bacterium]|nr:hypothetical protein [Pseudomonadota bacterium]
MNFEIDIVKAMRRKPILKGNWKETRIPAVGLVALMILLLAGVGLEYLRGSSSVDQQIKMNRRNKAYLTGQINQVEKELQKVREKLLLLSAPHGQSTDWATKLVDLSAIVPSDLWLTGLCVKTVKKVMKEPTEVRPETFLIIKGAADPTSGRKPLNGIWQLMSSLNGLESFRRHFEPIQLVSTQLARGRDRVLMEFKISAKLRHPSAQARRKEA